MIKLARLLPHSPFPLPDVAISGLKLDSRKVTSGDAFIAVPGYETDGRDYIPAAISAGASVVLADMDEWTHGELDGVPLIGVPQLKQQVSAIAGAFYQHPSRRMRLIGVTGTNGKTTVSNLAAQLWQQLKPEAAVLGTIGSGLLKQLLPEKNTTPDAVTVQHRLAGFLAEGAQVVAMEVSSHALVQGRVEALNFDTAVATNISRDHLDYHGSMAAYEAAKKRLFTDFTARVQILNADDPKVAAWQQPGTLWFSLDAQRIGQPRTLVAKNIQYKHDGTGFTLVWSGHEADASQVEEIDVKTSLLGDFNVANVLAASLTVLGAGYALADVAGLIASLQAVPGRMETFGSAKQPLVLVDYAHTPDALEQVLVAARRHCTGKLWCVFGCGGDRDRGKRPQMGAVAARLADVVVVTDDNPRTEEPEQIIADIVSGMSSDGHSPANYHAHPGRADAVKWAIRQAQVGDVVVCAGKGHEDYQIIGRKTVAYDERQWVQDVLGGRV
ncbi:UDP-N-acetylmuramoyl-L-alanyl-D-glutamate--2,6-diaminopimelate ligase [Aliidiomarina haloalkalitolerans]|uniref:UDP-N-acetylmuramoyl-L-alanyl-D-glutamate--2, 6-diaminopimelate ligase n=1 Tax=Aliidiomarina haloalkalitolerans TaxID=859059 RepID=UPI0018E51310|nr:UDP-N-acetylmuramoyl-L-alanyl-D-glutamate--2,6-diaminopimelate ligase [Aliidiomarina haloalkalitolerans]MCL4410725.1 UDP-N-acetylmuramoyl-L-alanyl-D-glutamate--2,6-diaminopimelate ligase [Gammaproteobacteria bacterium]